MRNGKGAILPPADPLIEEEFLAIASLDGKESQARIFMAAPITRQEIEEEFADLIEETKQITWDRQSEAVIARQERKLGALTLEEKPLAEQAGAAITQAMIDGIRQMGLHVLPWDKETRQLLARLRFIQKHVSDWPPFDEPSLLDQMEEWLAPFLGGVSRRAHLEKIELKRALLARLDWQQRQRLDAFAPSHLQVPSGSSHAIDYDSDPPVLSVKLQEMFGLADTPRIGNGKVPLLLHLLSPARRPVQVTSDLKGFWEKSYFEVRKDLRGQYPKHDWPDDPLRAIPTARAKRRQ